MPKRNSKIFKFDKLVLFTIGLVILWSQKSTPIEKDVNSICHLLKISIFLFKVFFVELYTK
jgi:hypothetical protein